MTVEGWVREFGHQRGERKGGVRRRGHCSRSRQ